jgi:pyruvate/2-oxoglutarate dehydrogenase complex dihydrolipoamide acyltransferase (E2) component
MTDSVATAVTPNGVCCTIIVPREIVNADSVFVVRWIIPDGDRVDVGSIVCEIETSKAAITVEACGSGYLRHQAVIGAEVPVGGVLGYIMADASTPQTTSPPETKAPAASNVSAKARRKIEELGIDINLFAGKGLVREEDVLAVAAQQRHAVTETDARGAFRAESLGPIQRRVARAMEQTAEIPTAYLERTINLEVVRKHAQDMTRDSKVLISVVDLLVSAVARVCSQFDRFNSCFVSESDVRVFDHVHVGVAVDVENDLYVVVVKDTDTKEVAAIARELRNLQYLAQRRRLEVDQLTGGTITVTSMLGRGVHRFQPLLFPQQSAIVGITDAEADGTACLTVGFDHRLANGSQAAGFLVAIEQELNS